MAKQVIVPGRLREKAQQELQEFLRQRLVQRLWEKDPDLWPRELVERDTALAKMEWLSLPGGLGQFLGLVRGSLTQADADGLVEHALLSSEGVNLCARALLELSGVDFNRNLTVLDSLSPEAIEKNEMRLDLRRTLFILANKERYGLKDHCLFLYFHAKLQAMVGTNASRHFVTETESRSYLASLSREYVFRDFVHAPPAIPAEYCSLRQFGAAFVALHAAETDAILGAMRQVLDACSGSDLASSNPALQLATFLSTVIADRIGYLAILTSPSLKTYAQRLGQLVGGSLAREGAGLIPVIGIAENAASAIESDAAFVLLSYPADEDKNIAAAIAEFQEKQIPFVHVELTQPLDLLTESFTWEIATILTCARRGIDPFEVSSNRLQRTLTDEILDQISQGTNPLQRSARLTDRLIQLYADGITRQEVSTLNFVEALRSFLRMETSGKHLSLLVDMYCSEDVRAQFTTLRSLASIALKGPVLMVFGPHAAEHTGYFFRESLPYGPCILFTTDVLKDKAIPGARYTFGQFYQALALSEYDTLVHWRRPVIRLHLSNDSSAALGQLIHQFQQALHGFHN